VSNNASLNFLNASTCRQYGQLKSFPPRNTPLFPQRKASRSDLQTFGKRQLIINHRTTESGFTRTSTINIEIAVAKSLTIRFVLPDLFFYASNDAR